MTQQDQAAERAADALVRANLIHREERPRAVSVLKRAALSQRQPQQEQLDWLEERRALISMGASRLPQFFPTPQSMTDPCGCGLDEEA